MTSDLLHPAWGQLLSNSWDILEFLADQSQSCAGECMCISMCMYVYYCCIYTQYFAFLCQLLAFFWQCIPPQLTDTLALMATDISNFIIILVMLIVAFMLMAHALFGSAIEEFSSLGSSFVAGMHKLIWMPCMHSSHAIYTHLKADYTWHEKGQTSRDW